MSTEHIELLLDHGLVMRAYNTLKRKGINTLKDLRELTIDDMRDWRNVGPATVTHILGCLDSYNAEHGGDGIKSTERKGTYGR
jgi:DNA-directed RNA polymerase alpha subunit